MDVEKRESQIALVVPVYNGERFLRSLLESVKAQTFGNWLCICVDDGSTDGSLAILNEFAEIDGRFVVAAQRNAGCGAARNAAIAMANAPFVMFADQDDVLHPRCFECALALMQRTDADAVCFKAVPFAETFEPPALPTKLDDIQIRRRGLPPGDQFVQGGTGCSIFVWRHIFRRSAIADVLFPPLSGGEDAVWMVELGWRNVNIVDASVVLYGNRHHADSGSRGLSRRYIDNVFRSYVEMRERGVRYGIDDGLMRRFLFRLAFWFVASAYYHGLRSGFYATRLFLRGQWRKGELVAG